MESLKLTRFQFSGSWRWERPWATTCSWQSSTTSWSSLSSRQVCTENISSETNCLELSFLKNHSFQTSKRESSPWLTVIMWRGIRTTQINTTTWPRLATNLRCLDTLNPWETLRELEWGNGLGPCDDVTTPMLSFGSLKVFVNCGFLVLRGDKVINPWIVSCVLPVDCDEGAHRNARFSLVWYLHFAWIKTCKVAVRDFALWFWRKLPWNVIVTHKIVTHKTL